MTDLFTAADADSAQTGVIDDATTPALAWTPRSPQPKKRRTAIWVSAAVGTLALAAVGASLVLIAPGTTVAGIPIGGLTPGAAAEVLSARLAATEISLTDAGDEAALTAADLGATIDARALADTAFAEHPLWKVGAWMPEPIPATITLDPAQAHAALRDSLPGSYTDAVDAAVVFDPAVAAFVAVPSVAGTGVDLSALSTAITQTLAAGDTATSFAVTPAAAPAAVTDADADAAAARINAMLPALGFYVGEERTVPVSPEVAATWLSVANIDGELRITADEKAIQAVIDTLPAAVNREPVGAQNIVDSGGKVLRELVPGVTGRALGATDGVATAFAAQLEKADPVFALPVTETPFETTTLVRRIEVNLSEQRTYLFENDQVVNSWAISSGTAATPSTPGRFRIFAHVRMQDMRGDDYVTEDVPWVVYYNGDEAFHGTYWHNNFGSPMSHGCVNMPISAAKTLYDWSPTGVEVWVHG